MDLEVALRNPEKVTFLWSETLPKPKSLERLGELTNLEELRLLGARSLPASIGELAKLKQVHFGARLTDVPDELAALGGTLERVWLQGTLPDAVERVVSLLAKGTALRELILSDVREVPPSIVKLKGPLELTLEPIERDELPDMVKVLAKARGLRALDLQQRKKKPKLPDLPLAALAPLKQLRKLELRFGYQSLPDELGELANLEELHLYSCKLTRLPDGLARLKKLRVLAADYGLGLVELPEWLSGWKALEELHLQGNKALTALPESLGDCKKLHTLELWDCGLTALPDSMAKLRALRVVKLSGNAIAALPEDFPAVETLELEGNPCAAAALPARGICVDHLELSGDEVALPDDALLVEQPRRLKLRMARLERLPPSVARLRTLEELTLDCPALDLAQAFELLGSVTTLRELELASKVNGPLPASFGALRSLVKLDARGCGITALPESIGELAALETLELPFNALTTLPASLARCTTLGALNLFHNPLARLPDVVGELPLKWLTVCRCPLAELPPSLAKLRTLVCELGAGLRFWESAFTGVPAVLADAPIEWLAFAKNDPPWDGPALLRTLAKNPHLRALSFEAGALTALPPEIGLLTGLTRLDLEKSDLALVPEVAGCVSLERVDLGRSWQEAKEAKGCLPPGRWKQQKASGRLWFARTG